MVTREQIEELDAGIDVALSTLQSALAQKVYAEKLPFFGDRLKAAFEAGEDALEGITALKDAIKQGINAILALSDAEYVEARIEAELNAALASFGLDPQIVDAVITGGELTLSFDTHRSFDFQPNFALATDLGMPGLDLETSGSVTAEAVYDFAFTVGVSTAGGAFLQTDAAQPELSLRLNAEVNEFDANAQLGFMNFSATDLNSYLDGTFAIDLHDTDGRLWLATELDKDFIDARFSGAAHLGLGLATNMGDAALPKASADLLVDWSFDNSQVVVGDNNASFGNAPTVRLENVAYDFGSFVEDFVKPVLSQLVPILQPMHQALAVLKADIDFLRIFPNASEMFDRTGKEENGQEVGDDRITLLDLLKIAMPEQNLVPVQQFIGIVDDVVQWAEFFLDRNFGDDSYVIGGFELAANIRDAATVLADAAPKAIAAAADLQSFIANLSGDWATPDEAGLSGKDVLSDMLGGSAFQFPILTDPTKAASLLLGGNVNLFSLDLPAMSFEVPETDLLTLPVFPGFNVKLAGAMSVALDMAFGYDTRGLTQFLQSVKAGSGDATKVLNGLFVSDLDSAGDDVPEAEFMASLNLLLEASLALASIGGGGGIQGLINLNLNDDVNGTPIDGKIYLDEMADALWRNPFTIFDASGLVTAGFSAFVQVGGYEVWRYASERIVLSDFNFSDEPVPEGSTSVLRPPPELGAVEEGILLLNVGPRAGQRSVTNAIAADETLTLSGTPDSLSVRGFGRTQEFTGISGISGDGGDGDDELILTNAAVSATISGGSGADLLFGGSLADHLDGGAHRDYLRGGDGDDTLLGGSGDDVLDGGAGIDEIDGGDGIDVLTFERSETAVLIDLASGDIGGDKYANIEVFEGSNVTSSGDTMLGSAGSDVLFGLAGDDLLDGRAGNDFLAGGMGADTIIGGTGADTMSGGDGDDLYYVDDVNDVTDDEMTGPRGGYDKVFAEADHTIGAGIEDLTLQGPALRGTGNDLANRIDGTDGDNILDGRGGADTLSGGIGNDIYYIDNAGDRAIDGAEQGRDEIRLYSSAATNSKFSMLADWALHIEDVSLSDAANSILVEGNSHGNRMTGHDNADELRGLSGFDTLSGGAGNDTLDGGTEIDILDGGEGDDVLLVRDIGGADTLTGGAGNDLFSFYSNSRTGYNTWTASASSPAAPVRITDFAGVGAGGDNLRIQVPGAFLVYAGYKKFDPANNDVFQFPNQGDGLSDLIYDHENGTTRVAVDVDDDGSFGERDLLIVLDGIHQLTAEDFVDTFNVQRGTAAADHLIGTEESDRLYGNAGNDTLEGLAGDDQLVGEQGNDSLLGGAGRDWLDGGDGDDTLDGGDGDDGRWSSLGGQSGIYGGAGADSLIGGAGDDVLYGDSGSWSGEGDGNDTISAGEGNDSVEGGGGNDLITGGLGVDQISGGSGDDEIYGEGDTDVIDGGEGADTIDGGEGDDYLYGDGGADSLLGGADDDIIYGGADADMIDGGDGDDTLYGEAGADTLRGGAGNDTLTGQSSFSSGEEGDLLEGGDGDDTLIVTDGGSTAGDTLTGGAGSDLFQIAASRWESSAKGPTGITDFTTGEDQIQIVAAAGATALPRVWSGRSEFGTDGTAIGNGADGLIDIAYEWRDGRTRIGVDFDDDGLLGLGDLVIELDGEKSLATSDFLARISALRGTAGADNLVGSEAADILFGLAGNDTITGLGEADLLSGGEGDDSIEGGAGNDTLDGGAGADILFGGDDRDVLRGSDGNDTLDGGGDIDDIDGGDGDDLIRGGDGHDAVFDLFGGRLHGLRGGAGNDTIEGGAGDDNLDGDAGNDMLSGDAGSDRLYGGTGADTLEGGEGRDYLYGGADDDLLDGGSENDVLYGEGGSDTLTGGIGDDDLSGGDDSDLLQGGDGNDSLEGDAGIDTLEGGAGNDTLDGGQSGGGDRLTGGVGDDLFRFRFWNSYQNASPADNSVVITDFEGAGSDGGDSIEIQLYSRLAAFAGMGSIDASGAADGLIEVAYHHQDGNTIIQVDVDDDGQIASDADLVILVQGEQNLTAGDFRDTFTIRSGTAGDDDLTGTAAGDHVFGLAGNDTMTGLDGNDTLGGGAGGDSISGGAGRDSLLGGEGDDWIDGGEGDDSTWSWGSQTIYYGLYGGDGQDTLLGGAGSDALFGEKGDDMLDGGAEADRLDGGAGDDTLMGGAGKDQLDGDAGNDWLVGGSDDDGLYGHTGNDTIEGEDGDDRLNGHEGNDSLLGGSGNDSLDGYYGDDYLDGGSGDDTLDGGLGSDELRGGAGADTLNGGQNGTYTSDEPDTLDGGEGTDLLILRNAGGGDQLTGGAEADIFLFEETRNAQDLAAPRDSRAVAPPSNPATITDFERGLDKLKMSVTSGNLAFAGHIAFSLSSTDLPTAGDGLMDVFYDTNEAGTGIRLAIDVDDDGALGAADMVIDLAGVTALSADDFTETFVAQRGTAQDELITGTTGADLIYSVGGKDTIDGLAGNDTLFGGTGSDNLLGGEGVDSLSGGAGADTLEGGEGDDAPGNYGQARGGLFGGDGNDLLKGGNGDDLLSGGADDDELQGGDGDDTLEGGTGHDALSGGLGLDSLDGGEGDDTLDGGADADRLYGQAGNDLLQGSAGADWLIGGLGNDTLDGGLGQDVLDGGGGINSFVYRSLDDAGDSIRSFTTGTFGDVIDVRGLLSSLNYEGSDPFQDGVLRITGDGSRLLLEARSGGTYTVVVEVDGYGDGFTAEELTKRVVFGASNTAPQAEDGRVLTVDEDTSVALGIMAPTDADGDALSVRITGIPYETYYRTGAVTLRDGTAVSFNSVLTPEELAGLTFTPRENYNGSAGTLSYEVVDGRGGATSGRVTIEVNPINDIPTVSAPSDITLEAGETSYWLRLDYPSDADFDDLTVTVISVPTGGSLQYNQQVLAANDVIEPYMLQSLVFHPAEGASGDLGSFEYSVDDGQGGVVSSSVSFTKEEDVGPGPSDGPDLLEGDAEGNNLSGLGGDDTIHGFGGDDWLNGNDGQDLLTGGQGHDNLYGGNGNDTLSGGSGDDGLFGEDGDDVLRGGDGNDTLSGGAGADTMTGGLGEDLFLAGHGDTIRDFGAGDVLAIYNGFDVPVGLFGYNTSYRLDGSTLVIDPDTFVAGDEIYLTLEDFPADATLSTDAYGRLVFAEPPTEEPSTPEGAEGDDYLIGTDRSETISGRGGNDFIDGALGNDTLLGGDGQDILYGGRGDDLLEGGEGLDLLDGGDGADTLTGGAGDDYFAAGDGDTITDFGPREVLAVFHSNSSGESELLDLRVTGFSLDGDLLTIDPDGAEGDQQIRIVLQSLAENFVLEVNNSGQLVLASSAPPGNVTITGTAAQGQTLVASHTLTDVAGPDTVTWQWLRDGYSIAGANVDSYTLTQADVGAAITVVASYTAIGGAYEIVPSGPTAPVANVNDAPTGAVMIDGTAVEGAILTAFEMLDDADGLGTVAWQWQRDGSAIPGATGSTYTLGKADIGAAITVRASYTDGHGAAESVASSPVVPVARGNHAPTGSVVISGEQSEGQTLTASNTLSDVDGLGSITYQWLAGGAVIAGATGATYTLTQAEVGKTITVKASYTDQRGTSESVSSGPTAAVANVNDLPTGIVAIAGTPTQGETLRASNTLADEDGLGPITYQWLAGGAVIAGATGATYTLTQAEVGKTITVRASYRDQQGTPESVASAATAAVADVNDLPTGIVAISGTPTQGETLRASNTLADEDGLGAITYQWRADGADIAGATGASYTLTQAEVGKAITVVARYTDGQGTDEAVASVATAAVASSTEPNPPSGTVDGVPVQTETVTNPDGSTSQRVTIPVVTSDRPDQSGNPATADIPLVRSSAGTNLLTAEMPAGYGLQVTGSATPKTAANSLADLIREITAHTDAGSADQEQLTRGGSGFLSELDLDTPLLVQTIVPTVAPGASAPGEPLVIRGHTQPDGPRTTLIIDVRGLPSGSHIQLQNVDFAIIIGAVTVTGGEGSQIVWGDSSSQYIVLGEDDDILHGGAGDDTIGSEGGDDWLFGDDGDDHVFGGVGNDTLDGGSGVDVLTGGAGADLFEGVSSSFYGDTIIDFTEEDEIVFRGVEFARANLTTSTAPMVFVVDHDRDGSADGSFTLEGDFSGGDFMAVSDGTDTWITFEKLLPSMKDGRALDSTLVRGVVNQKFLTGNGERDFEVSLVDLGHAGHDNAVGLYEILPDGTITDVRILFENANKASGPVRIEDVDIGATLGFFLIQDGADFIERLSEEDSFSFIDANGAAASVDDGARIQLALNGQATGRVVFHSYSSAMNIDGLQHATSGVDIGGATMTIGFEDLTGGGDRDYEDVVFRVAHIESEYLMM